MIKLCIAGATGRMGTSLMKEAAARGFQVVGAVVSPSNSSIERMQRCVKDCDSDIKVVDSTHLEEAVKDADVYVTFTTPAAELANLPLVANMGKRIVMGTTGFTTDQMDTLRDAIRFKAPAVFSPNYALGINILFKLIKTLGLFPPDYDFGLTEIHHIGKKDAPSGTAQRICELVSQIRGYTNVIHGREGMCPRHPNEMEVFSARAGGVPGIHQLMIAGAHEMIRIEHMAFSRSVFAEGALRAAEWIHGQNRPGIYAMDDVLQ
ncbi:MAG: 4-hydroxy-tetrahydrodipicolinate reductase [archaeon]